MSLSTDQFLFKFRQQGYGVITDDSSQVIRSVLVAPCAGMTAGLINNLLTLGRGLIFVAISPTRAAEFALEPMVRDSTDRKGCSLQPLSILTSVEAREGVSTGISAADRATTIRVLGSQDPHPRLLVKPGHILPVLTRTGGVLVKQALPEGALDVVKLSGNTDAAVFIEILGQDGSFAPTTTVTAMCEHHDIPHLSLTELTRYRLQQEPLITLIAEARLPTRAAGEMKMYIFQSILHSGEHVALVRGTIDSHQPVLTRVQAERTFSDVFGSTADSSKELIQRALRAIGKRDNGVLVYLRSPSAGELAAQITGLSATSESKDVIMRQYGIGAQILRYLGIKHIDLLTTSQRHYRGLDSFGISIQSQVPLENW